MAPLTNTRILFNSIPSGFPEPGKTTVLDRSQKIDLESVQLNGGFLIKTLVLSIDPYMRGRMREPDVKSYMTPFKLGEPLESHGIGVVLRSETANIKAGDHVHGMMPHEEYSIHQDESQFRVLDNKYRLPWSVYLGVAGMPGKTAYMGWKEFSRSQPGETAFITGAAGGVGSFVVQLAHWDGLKVIASTGTEDKVKWVKSLGADVVFNWKETDMKEVLNKEGPINIFWDGVGGPALDAALGAAANHARFIECGMISCYNTGGEPLHNYSKIVDRSINMHGFIVNNLESKYDEEFYHIVPAKVATGELKFQEDVVMGLEKVGDAILAVQKGTTKAKCVVAVAEE